MDLQRHLRVLWKHRLVMAVGILVGSLLAILASYHLQPGKSPLITPRGQEEWRSVSRLLVTQEGFPEGRVTLPAAVAGKSGSGGLEFADPARFQGLASLYAVLVNSDQVRARLRERPERKQISAVVVDPDGQGSLTSLPVIELSTVAESAAAARRLNTETVAALRGVLAEQQNDNEIDDASRVRLDSLDLPSAPILVSGRSQTASIVVFMIALVAAIAFAQLIEGVGGNGGLTSRSKRSSRATAAALESAYADQSLGDGRLPERPPPQPDEVAAGSQLPRL